MKMLVGMMNQQLKDIDRPCKNFQAREYDAGASYKEKACA
jgi:hypothetical protein